ncbi:uncharacterized protein LOC141900802 [Tubulanus polymorphus]|uniref:uncharacterized protein LOC141900802 n=1 Tax=Tubulanus polymorphus TaxID=672921 RepID=UPI003DA51486
MTKAIVHGNCHQGHPKFGVPSGKQCVANSLAAIIHPMNNVEMKAGKFGVIMELSECLHTVLDEYNACFVTFAGNTFCVLNQDGVYWVFDSHSRDSNGMMTADGFATIVFQWLNLDMTVCLLILDR